MADIAIGLLNQKIADSFIEAGTPHNWVEVSDEPAKKTCIRNNSWSGVFEVGRGYEYIETGDKEFETQLDIASKRGFKIGIEVSKMVKDKNGDWHRYPDFAFREHFTIKQPNQ
jgi:endo-beta-N-acetylglucosaminidase D